MRTDRANVGIGVLDPDANLEVRGTIKASHTDADHGMILESGGTLRRDYGSAGAGMHFTGNAIWPTDYLGAYTNGGTEFGGSSYRWNNIYTTDLNVSSKLGVGVASPTAKLEAVSYTHLTLPTIYSV